MSMKREGVDTPGPASLCGTWRPRRVGASTERTHVSRRGSQGTLLTKVGVHLARGLVCYTVFGSIGLETDPAWMLAHCMPLIVTCP